MALRFPTLKEILDRSRSDVRAVLPKLQPSLAQSFIKAIVDSNSGRAFDVFNLLKELLDQAFPQTAVGVYLARWGEYDDLSQTGPQVAVGNIVVQGTLIGASVPALTSYTSASASEYQTQAGLVLALVEQVLLTAVANSTTKVVTCTTDDPHSLATGIAADFTGLTNSANTSAAVVQVIDDNTFSFIAPDVSIDGSVVGVLPKYSFIGGKVQVESILTGVIQNVSSGGVLTLVSPITNVNSEAFVDNSQLLGGTDGEEVEDFRDRILERRANPVSNFNSAAILKQIRTIPSVSRVFILPITPYPGAVTIFFFVKDTSSGIPTSGQIDAVRAAVLEINPATTDPDDIVVTAPDTVTIDHQISNLAPGIQSMKDAITANLQAFYEDQVTNGMSITVDMIRLVIQNSQDPILGGFPTSFTLDLPAGTTAVSYTEIATFGSVSFV